MGTLSPDLVTMSKPSAETTRAETPPADELRARGRDAVRLRSRWKS